MSSERDNKSNDEKLVSLYLNEIGQHPLLTKADEVELGHQVMAGMVAYEEISHATSINETIEAERARELKKLQDDGNAAAKTFIQANLRLVVSIAKGYQNPGVQLLDLIQEGNLGLMHAVQKFNPDKGFKFSTYGTWWIRQAITLSLDNTGRTVRLPAHVSERVRLITKSHKRLSDELGREPSIAEIAADVILQPADVEALLRYGEDHVSLDASLSVENGNSRSLKDVLVDRTAIPVDEQATSTTLTANITEALQVLDEREREIIRLRYGLDSGEPRTLEEVGLIIGLTRERIRQLEARAQAKLRHPSSNNGLASFLNN